MSVVSIVEDIATALSLEPEHISLSSVHGGDTHDSFRVITPSKNYFVKTANRPDSQAVLQAEYTSLCLMREYGAVSYPVPSQFLIAETNSLLLMEFHSIELVSQFNAKEVAHALADQHQIQDKQFGWPQNNFIGHSLQNNTTCESWIDFFVDSRISPQLAWAYDKGLSLATVDQIERLLPRLDIFIDESEIEPSLVHGDLWSGNLGYDSENNAPIFYDPAPYFGDPLVDIAMTELFGRLSAGFYSAYSEVTETRKHDSSLKDIYNLYHALNHFNLFGAAYHSLVSDLISRIPH